MVARSLSERLISLWGVILLVCFVQTGFLLLPGPFWDGWIYETLFLRNNYEEFIRPYVNNGRPLGGWVLWHSMSLFNYVHTPKYMMAASLVGSAIAIYATFRIRNWFSPASSWLVAIVTTTVPAVQTVVALSMLQFYLGFFTFFFGLYCFVLSDTLSCGKRVPLYLLSLILAGVAVMLAESPLALLPVYPAILIMNRLQADVSLVSMLRKWRELLIHSAPVLVGVVALLATFYLYPTIGTYKGAHQITLSFGKLAIGSGLFIIVFLGTYGLVICYLYWLWKRREECTFDYYRIFSAVAFCGIVILLGILPYLVAGRWPSIFGWGARMMLFSGFGVGLMLMVIANALIEGMPKVSRMQSIFIIGMICISITFARVPLWSARQVKDDVIQTWLSDNALAGVGVVWVNDDNWVIAGPYRVYELTALVQRGMGRDDVMALPSTKRSVEEVNKWLKYLSEDHRLLEGVPKTDKTVEIFVESLPYWWYPYSFAAVIYRKLVSENAYRVFIRDSLEITKIEGKIIALEQNINE